MDTTVAQQGVTMPQEGSRAVVASVREARVVLSLLGCWLTITAAWWALALAPVADPPVWLEAARSVCFGSTKSGLPDTYGWVVLAAAPGTMLVAIVVTWFDELTVGVAALRSSLAGRVAMAAVAVFVTLGLVGAGQRIAAGLAIDNASFDPAEAGALPAAYPRLNGVVPAFSLIDQEGRPLRTDDLKGHVTLFTFAFAHCHTVCPAIVQTMRSTAAKMGDQAPDMVVLTLDPWRDTPSRLPQMHKDWQMPASVRVLSGEVGDVTAALDGFNVPWTRDEATGDVSHPALVYAVDAEGRIAYGFNNPSVDWLVDATGRLQADAKAVAAR
jgi:protein SCO1/2